MRGKGRLPVADYSFAAQIMNQGAWSSASEGVSMTTSTSGRHQQQQGDSTRHVYSFCKCPGGQVVCTSTTEDSLCVNGMSFRWVTWLLELV